MLGLTSVSLPGVPYQCLKLEGDTPDLKPVVGLL